MIFPLLLILLSFPPFLTFGSSVNGRKIFLDDGVPGVRSLEEYLGTPGIFVPGFQVDSIFRKLTAARKLPHPRLLKLDVCDLYTYGTQVLSETIPKYLEMNILRSNDVQIALHFFQLDSLLDFMLLRTYRLNDSTQDISTMIHRVLSSRRRALDMLRRDLPHRKFLIDFVTLCPSFRIQKFVLRNIHEFSGIYQLDISPMVCLSQLRYMAKSPAVDPFDAMNLKSLLIGLLSSRLEDRTVKEYEKQQWFLHFADNCFFMSSMRISMILASALRSMHFAELTCLQYCFSLEEWQSVGFHLAPDEVNGLPDLFKALVSKKTLHEHHQLLADSLLLQFKRQMPAQIAKHLRLFAGEQISEAAMNYLLQSFPENVSIYSILQEPKSILDFAIVLAILLVKPNFAFNYCEKFVILARFANATVPVSELFAAARFLGINTPENFRSLKTTIKLRKYKSNEHPTQPMEMLASLALTLMRSFQPLIQAALDSEKHCLVASKASFNEHLSLLNHNSSLMFLKLCHAITSYDVEREDMVLDLDLLGFAPVMQSDLMHSNLRTLLLEALVSMYLTRGLSLPSKVLEISVEAPFSFSNSLCRLRRTSKVLSTSDVLSYFNNLRKQFNNQPIIAWIVIWAALPRIIDGDEGAREFGLLLNILIPQWPYPKVDILRQTTLTLLLEHSSFAVVKEMINMNSNFFPPDSMNFSTISSRKRVEWLSSREFTEMKNAPEMHRRAFLNFAIIFSFKDSISPCTCHFGYLESYFKGEAILCVKTIGHVIISGIACVIVQPQPLILPRSFLQAVFLDSGNNLYPSGVINRFRFELENYIDLSLMSVDLRSIIVDALSLKEDDQQAQKEALLLRDLRTMIRGNHSDLAEEHADPKPLTEPKAATKEAKEQTSITVSNTPTTKPATKLTPAAPTTVVRDLPTTRKAANPSSRPPRSRTMKLPSSQATVKDSIAEKSKNETIELKSKAEKPTAVEKPKTVVEKPKAIEKNPKSAQEKHVAANTPDVVKEKFIGGEKMLMVSKDCLSLESNVAIEEPPKLDLIPIDIQSSDECIVKKPTVEVQKEEEESEEKRIPPKLAIKQLRKNTTILPNGVLRPKDFPSTPFKLFIYANLKEGGSFPFKLDSKFLAYLTKGENRELFAKSTWKPIRGWTEREVWKPKLVLPVKVYGEQLSYEQIKNLKAYVLGLPEEELPCLQSLVFYSNHCLESLSDTGPYAARSDFSRKTLKFQIVDGLQSYRIENGWIQMPEFPKNRQAFLDAISTLLIELDGGLKKGELSSNALRKAHKVQIKRQKPEVATKSEVAKEQVKKASKPANTKSEAAKPEASLPKPEIVVSNNLAIETLNVGTLELVNSKDESIASKSKDEIVALKSQSFISKPPSFPLKRDTSIKAPQPATANTLKAESFPKFSGLSSLKLTPPIYSTKCQFADLGNGTSASSRKTKSRKVPKLTARSQEAVKFEILKREKTVTQEASLTEKPAIQESPVTVKAVCQESSLVAEQKKEMSTGLKVSSKEFIPASIRSLNLLNPSHVSGSFYLENYSNIVNIVTPNNYIQKYAAFCNLFKKGVEYIALDCEMTGLYTRADELAHQENRDLKKVENTQKLIWGVHENQMFQLGLTIKSRDGNMSIWSFYNSPFLTKESFTPETFDFLFIRPFREQDREEEGRTRALKEIWEISQNYVNVVPFLSLILTSRTPLVLFSGYVDLMHVLKASNLPFDFTHEGLQMWLNNTFYDTKYAAYKEYQCFFSLKELMQKYYKDVELDSMRLHDASYDALLTALVFEAMKEELGDQRLTALSRVLFKFYEH